MALKLDQIDPLGATNYTMKKAILAPSALKQLFFGAVMCSSERAKIALLKKVGVKLAFLAVYNDSEIEPYWPFGC
jgi:hypothetical protein